MRRIGTLLLVFSAAAISVSAAAQNSPAVGLFGQSPRFKVLSELTAADRDRVRAHATATIPTFSGSFSYEGKNYDYIMAGGAPEAGGTTTLPTAIQPVKFVFEGTTDPSTGQPYVLDGGARLNDVVNSPDFQPANYTVGDNLQFQDAVQNAQFYGVRGANYHTIFATPRILPTQTVTVPAGMATLSTTAGGSPVATMSIIYWYAQLFSIRDKAGFKTTEVPLVLTDSVLMYELTPSQCCVVGFHEAYTRLLVGTQVLAWASYVEPGTFSGDTFVDVTAISHELAELVNDPFVSKLNGRNDVPSWEFPGETKCQGNLETGDPVEVLPDPGFPVTIGSTIYHPQTEAMLQWFERSTPSTAFNGAYSYPDTTALTAPAKDCGT